MSNRKENIKKLIVAIKPERESRAVTSDKESIEDDGNLITTVAATATATFFTFRALGTKQHSALLVSILIIYSIIILLL